MATDMVDMHANMEADPFSDRDSTFGGDRDSLASSSTSLQSAITRYRYIQGRRYHAYQAGAYNFPNDEQELNRMDIEHQNQLVQLDGRLHLCPLQDPQQVLDLGTGTGIWAIEMADQYPMCQVIGSDLSPVQPTWIPPNCKFEVDDFELEWVYGENRFDMVYARFLLGSVSSASALYKKAYAALKPGGWIELVDMECGAFSDDSTLSPDAALVKWGRWMEEAFYKIGKPIVPVVEYPKLLRDAGFVNVHWEMVKRPMNDWPKDKKMKEVGRYCCLNFIEGLEGFTMSVFTQALGWTPKEVEVLVAQVRAETVKRSIHAWQKAFICYAQKPLDSHLPGLATHQRA